MSIFRLISELRLSYPTSMLAAEHHTRFDCHQKQQHKRHNFLDLISYLCIFLPPCILERRHKVFISHSSTMDDTNSVASWSPVSPARTQPSLPALQIFPALECHYSLPSALNWKISGVQCSCLHWKFSSDTRFRPYLVTLCQRSLYWAGIFLAAIQ